MNTESLTAFLEMGGYAAYVWPCFGLTFGLMIVLWYVSRRTLRRTETELEVLQAAQGRGRKGPAGAGDAA